MFFGESVPHDQVALAQAQLHLKGQGRHARPMVYCGFRFVQAAAMPRHPDRGGQPWPDARRQSLALQMKTAARRGSVISVVVSQPSLWSAQFARAGGHADRIQ